jgi:hypothetical protein
VVRDHFYDRPVDEGRWGKVIDDAGGSWRIFNPGHPGDFVFGVPDDTSPTGRNVGELRFLQGVPDGSDIVAYGVTTENGIRMGGRKAYFAHQLKFMPGWIYHGLGVKMTLAGLARPEGSNPSSYNFYMGGATDGGNNDIASYRAPKLLAGTRGMPITIGADPPLVGGGEIFPYNVAIPPLLPTGSWITWETYIDLGTPGQNNGVVREWMNGQQVTNYTQIRFPSDALDFSGGFAMPHTWGGGGLPVQQNQWIRYANTRIVVWGP